MNKIIKYTHWGLFVTCIFFIASCKKNNVIIDRPSATPAFAKFNTIAPSDSANTYYINSSNDVYKLPIGVTNVSNKDRTITFTYSSATAVQGQQYNAPASIVIKAGQTIDTLVIAGLYAGYPSSDKVDVLKISITGGDVPASSYKNNYYLTLRKFCNVVLTDFYGDYYNTIDNGSYGPYHVIIVPESGVPTGDNTATIQIENLWDPGVPVFTTLNLDFTSIPFKVSIPDQPYSAPDGIWIKSSVQGGSTAYGSFSSCDQSFTLKYDLYYKDSGLPWQGAVNQVTEVKR